MFQNMCKKIGVAVLIVGLFFIAFNCEDYEDEDFMMEMVDEHAAEVMAVDTVFNELQTVSLLDTLGYMHLKFAAGVEDSIENGSLTDVMNYLDTTLAVAPARTVAHVLDTIYNVVITKKVDEHHVNFVSNQSGNVVIYASDFVDMLLWTADGEMIEPTVDTMPLELMSGLYVLDNDVPVPVINTRYVFPVQSSDYLLQIIRTESTSDTEFHMVLVNE